MPRLYHPNLGREIDAPDDDAYVAVLAESGWKLAPEPEARPGYEPEPVVYAPVTDDKADKTSRSKPKSTDS